MKKLFYILFLLICSVNVFAQYDENTYTKLGDHVPLFNFEIEKGKTVNIADYKGKVILINLFATWCPPCNVELPLMQKEIWEKHKNNEHFALFVFGREEGWDKLIPYKTKKGFTFPILPDLNRMIFSNFAKQTIPRNILINEEGEIIYQSDGFDKKEFIGLIKLINNQLNSKSTTK